MADRTNGANYAPAVAGFDAPQEAATGSRALNRRTVLGAWWPAVDAMVQAEYGERATLTAHIPPGLPAVRIAPHDLTRIVLDLVANAVHAIGDRVPGPNVDADPATGPQPGEVKISAWLARNGQAVDFTVAHNGVGMDPSTLGRVFEPFSADPARRGGMAGSLAAVRRLVGASGGAVRISSAVGAGTTITIRLPIHARNHAQLEEVPVA